ncbi:MAG: DUF814 domain-containing protein, partial [Candidatus Latescibacteria bacterium]|nr:DUF814 domain-containing protein [Candidatus Latescibacterota bacterium]
VAAAETPESLVTRLVGRVGGLSPAMAREVVAGAGLTEADEVVRCSPDERRARLSASLAGVIDRVRTGRWMPMIGLDPAGQPGILSAIPLASLPPDRRIVCATMSEAIVRFYAARAEVDRVRQQATRLRRVLADDVARLDRLVVNLTDDLAKAARGDEFRKYGDLLTAHLSVLRRGQPEAAVPDLYDPGQSLLRIPLDPALSPADNAKAYFKHAKKARDGRAIIERRLAQARERLERVRTLRGRMEGELGAGVVERVHRECVRWELIRESRDGTKATGRPKPKRKAGDIHPRRFLTADGWVVLVGRNDRENEVLTKTAAPDDLWFHARGIGGSHVILRREGRKAMPSQAARYEAACVAAYFSKARGSTTVAVDYTERRYVRKQKDGKPGQVVFTHEKTLFVEPKLLKEQDSSLAAII